MRIGASHVRCAALSMVMACALAVGLVGCGSQASTPEESQHPTVATETGYVGETEAERRERIASSWAYNTELPESYITGDAAEVIAQVTNNGEQDDLGWRIRPVVLLATKKGTNGFVEKYGVLCQASVGGESVWCVLTVDMTDTSADIPKKVFANIDPVNLAVVESWEGPATQDGWSMAGSYAAQTPTLPADAQKVYANAVKAGDTNGVAVPLAHIASQVADGVNYLYLVQTTSSDGGGPALSFVTVSRDSKGSCSVISREYMDIASYLR